MNLPVTHLVQVILADITEYESGTQYDRVILIESLSDPQSFSVRHASIVCMYVKCYLIH